MTDTDWRQQAERAFRSALDAAPRVTGSAEAGRMTALRAALDTAEPLIAAAERERIRAVLDPGKIAWLIRALDLIDDLARSRGVEPGAEAQDDLRNLAELLGGTDGQ